MRNGHLPQLMKLNDYEKKLSIGAPLLCAVGVPLNTIICAMSITKRKLMMSEQMSLWAAYNGTGGFVSRPASKERAEREIADGSLSKRQEAILCLLAEAGSDGMTWKQLGDKLGLHHGKVSGALSNMHKFGVVFMLQQRRDRCHPYVHFMFRDYYETDERYDEPTKTKGNQQNELLLQLLEVCRDARNNGWTQSMTESVNNVVATIEAHEQSQKQS